MPKGMSAGLLISILAALTSLSAAFFLANYGFGDRGK